MIRRSIGEILFIEDYLVIVKEELFRDYWLLGILSVNIGNVKGLVSI